MTKIRTDLLRNLGPVLAAMAVMAGCADQPATGSIESPGMLNGMLNGLFRIEGFTAFLAAECPLLKQRLLEDGQLTDPFPEAFASEIADPECDHFMFYTAQVMVPFGETLTLTAGGHPVASYAGVMGLEHLVAQAYPQYTFTEHAFLPPWKIARVLATQVYAAITNSVTRTVSFKTNVPEMDAHREPIEDSWTRELAELVPATPEAIAAMLNEPGFLARLPDFFDECDIYQTSFEWALQQPSCDVQLAGIVKCKSMASFGPPMQTKCPVPIVVRGNDQFDPAEIPGHWCRILRPGESLPPGTFLNNAGNMAVPYAGCPLAGYAGDVPGQIVYDDRAVNQPSSDEGCDFNGPTPSSTANCVFNIDQDGQNIASARIATWVLNVPPI